MNIFTVQLTNKGASLTGYVYEQNEELPNTRIRPAVLVFPGGAYMLCSSREADPVALAYLAEGYHAFVLRYTVGSDEPAEKSFSDASEAIEYLYKHADEMCIDKNKIAVVGFSAGGHLAAWLGVYGQVKPAATILGYPCILIETGERLGKDLPELCGKVDCNTPPAFIFSTRNDPLVPVAHSLRYADALDQAKVDFELHIFGDGEHALSLAKPFTSGGNEKLVNADVAQWFQLSINWLARIFGRVGVL